jgi:hypothetical protein
MARHPPRICGRHDDRFLQADFTSLILCDLCWERARATSSISPRPTYLPEGISVIASRWVIRNSTHRFQFSVALVSDATVQLQTCSGRRLKFGRASSSAAIGQGPSALKFPTHHPTHDSRMRRSPSFTCWGCKRVFAEVLKLPSQHSGVLCI